MWRKLLFGLGLVILVVAGLSVYVAVPVTRDLRAAQSILMRPADEITASDIDRAETLIRDAGDRLDGVGARVLRLVPIARQNVTAVDAFAGAALPTLHRGRTVATELAELRRQELMSGSRVRLGVLGELGSLLTRQTEALAALEETLADHRTGWLLPPVWDAIDDLARRTGELEDSARRASRALALAEPMLGAGRPRTYLLVLINNAELRGAGGILSGVGTLSANNGKLSLGRFYYYGDLDERPQARVDAPADLARRFGRYRADTTVWVNATASPDVPEVAALAATLFQRATGETTDGAVIVDPRGVAALLPPDTTISQPAGPAIPAEDLPRYAYSTSYERGTSSDARRRQILELGSSAFGSIVNRASVDATLLKRAAAAQSGQHIRVVSFYPAEQKELTELGASGDLSTPADDSVFVTVQNLGGDKLDFWTRRSVSHSCNIEVDVARCLTRVEIANRSPRGLPGYVVQTDKPSYALYRGYLEIYVPEDASVSGAELNGETATVFREQEDGRTSLGMYFRLPRSEKLAASVSYELPLNGSYSLTLGPQPLTHDAELEVHLDAPGGWSISGSGRGGDFDYSGRFDSSLRISARPDRRTGLSAVWRTLVEFWKEPVF
jgi:Protein of unknown function (DUF4012)